MPLSNLRSDPQTRAAATPIASRLSMFAASLKSGGYEVCLGAAPPRDACHSRCAIK